MSTMGTMRKMETKEQQPTGPSGGGSQNSGQKIVREANFTKNEIAYHTTIRYGGFGPQPSIALPAASQVATIGANGNVEQ